MGGAPPLALTQGDPAGIGPEISVRAWLDREEFGLTPFLVLANPGLLRDCAIRLGAELPIAETEPGGASSQFDRALPVLPLSDAFGTIEPGRPDPASAAGTIESIARAVALTRAGETSGVVTNPIAKHVLYEAGFRHPGHTEYLASLATPPGGIAPRAVMLLWSPDLAVVPVTIHVPLREVPAMLTEDLIVDTARIVARDMRSRFGLGHPRLAFSGLNPHAGEAGTIGREERDVIEPAIARLRAEGIDAQGPFPADTMFHARARRGYDVALAMYHDQALVPLKTLAFDEGVNVTLGLPFIRTSPDHGTAFDIAGRSVARPDSLVAALRLAGRLAAHGAART